jgi:uncharacterized protein
MMLILCLMAHCNNQCKFCLVRQEMAEAEDIPLEKIKAAVANLPIESGVDFFGGEPTLYPYFLEALAYTRSKGHRCTIASNARKFSDLEFARKVCLMGVDQIRTSIYGDTQELHDLHTRCEGSFRETISGIKNIIELGVDLYVNTVITAQNYQRLPAIVDLMHSLGVRYVKFGTLVDGTHCLDLVPDLSLVRVSLAAAINRCQHYGIDVAIEKSPLCIAPDHYSFCVYEPDDKLYVKVPECKNCFLSNQCVGLTKEQVQLFGDDIVASFKDNGNNLSHSVNRCLVAEDHVFLKWDDDLPPAVTLLVKVAGTCNLACDYCYASRNFNKDGNWISDDLLDLTLSQLKDTDYGRIDFDLHGGEPLTWDREHFEYFISLQKKMKISDNKKVVNRIQVNGTLITDDWAKFLSEMDIEIGVSLDGPKEVHDAHRYNHARKGSFISVMKGLEILINNKVELAVLSVVTPETVKNVLPTFRFFSNLVKKSNGLLKTINFLPSFEIDFLKKELLPSTISSEQYADFLIMFFDKWFASDNENFHIVFFEEIIAVLLGGIATTCNFRRGCDGFLTLEPDGSLYPCDRFSGLPEFKLGNVYEQSLHDILNGDSYTNYIDQVQAYPLECLQCEWLRLCRGECLYHAWALNPKSNLPSYYCPSLKTIYNHIEKTLIDNLDGYERYSRVDSE